MPDFRDYIMLTESQQKASAGIDLLDVKELAQLISQELLAESVSLQQFSLVNKGEWDAYRDLKKG